jgi:hypothetical protein
MTFIVDTDPPAMVYDHQVRLENLLMGPGTAYELAESFVPNKFPQLDSTDTKAPLTDGMIGGLELMGSRRIPVPIMILCTNKTDAYQALRDLGYAWRPRTTNVPLYWRDDISEWFVLGRPRLADPNTEQIHDGYVEIDARFEALDPRIYENVLTLASGDVDDVLDITSNGTLPAPWTATITGDGLANPVLTHSSGKQIRIAGTLLSTQTLTLEVTQNAYGIYRIDGVPYGVLPGSEWFLFDPGYQTITLTADSGTGTLDVETRDAFLL